VALVQAKSFRIDLALSSLTFLRYMVFYMVNSLKVKNKGT